MTRNIFVLRFAIIIIVSSTFYAVANIPRFRILAPLIICPKDENSPIKKPDHTVITIQSNSEAEFFMEWTVRWYPLKAPTQRFTLILWRAVRALEARLNGPQAEPFVYIINDDELLYGVNYIFTVTAKSSIAETTEPKTFYINNTFGEQTLEALDGRTDVMSLVLVGGQTTYADITYVLEAEVSTCVPMYDYHFLWNIQNEDLQESLNISTTGCRLEIPPYSLEPGGIYDVTCYVLKDDTKEIITQIELPFEVEYRGLEVYLSVDRLIVGIHQSFTLESIVINYDYLTSNLSFEWLCSTDGGTCDFFENATESSLNLSSGIPSIGQYEITVNVSSSHQFSQAKAIIIAVAAILPTIRVEPSPRVLNEGTTTSLTANVSNVTPICTLTWYFATEVELNTFSIDSTEEQHGTSITDTEILFSLEENFLSELADYTNETYWRQVTAEFEASAGRARFVTECNCSVTFGCGTREVMYADVHFKLNKAPKPAAVMVSPSSGIALETIFRVSTRAASDPDGPLRYTFYCRIGNYSLILGSYLEHQAVETLLPYVESGSEVWVQVCDVLGACSATVPKVVTVSKGEGRSINFITSDIRAHVKRCEIILLQRATISTILTYNNAGQMELLKVFTAFLIGILPTLPINCISQYQQCLDLLEKLALVGLDLREHTQSVRHN